jgi:hypothetical protein
MSFKKKNLDIGNVVYHCAKYQIQIICLLSYVHKNNKCVDMSMYFNLQKS